MYSNAGTYSNAPTHFTSRSLGKYSMFIWDCMITRVLWSRCQIPHLITLNPPGLWRVAGKRGDFFPIPGPPRSLAHTLIMRAFQKHCLSVHLSIIELSYYHPPSIHCRHESYKLERTKSTVILSMSGSSTQPSFTTIASAVLIIRSQCRHATEKNGYRVTITI